MFVGNITSTSVGASSPFLWNQKYLTNNNVSYNSATGTLTIKTPGWYEISVDATGTAIGEITPVVYINSVASTTALASATSSGAADFVNVSFDTVFRVVPAYSNTFTTIKIVNTGDAATITAANIVVKRIG